LGKLGLYADNVPERLNSWLKLALRDLRG